jgi:hypothetical protein
LRKIKTKIAIQLVKFGIWIYDQNWMEQWDEEDKENVRKLWILYEKMKADLK